MVKREREDFQERAKWQGLMREFKVYALEMADGSNEALFSLLGLITGRYQDSVPINLAEASKYLVDESLLSLQLAKFYLGEFKQNFADFNRLDELVVSDYFRNYVSELGSAFSGIIDRDSRAIYKLTNATVSFQKVLDVAEEMLVAGRTR